MCDDSCRKFCFNSIFNPQHLTAHPPTMLQNNNQKSGAEVRAQIDAAKKRRQEEEEERKRREAEAEAEEARQLAELEAAEEWQRVAEAERVAEEVQKQEEEEQRQAAEIAAQQGVVGGSGDRPMDVDRTAEEEKTKKKKNKGKGKQTAEDEEEEEMELVGGAARCHACMQDNEQCRVNMQASVEAGRVTARAPTGTSCLRCNTSLHRPCDLPGTHDLWKKVNARKAEIATEKAKAAAGGEEVKVAGGSKRKGTEEPQAASRSKRRRVVVEVEPRNKPQELTEGEFHLRVVELMGMLVDEVKECGTASRCTMCCSRGCCVCERGWSPRGTYPSRLSSTTAGCGCGGQRWSGLRVRWTRRSRKKRKRSRKWKWGMTKGKKRKKKTET